MSNKWTALEYKDGKAVAIHVIPMLDIGVPGETVATRQMAALQNRMRKHTMNRTPSGFLVRRELPRSLTMKMVFADEECHYSRCYPDLPKIEHAGHHSFFAAIDYDYGKRYFDGRPMRRDHLTLESNVIGGDKQPTLVEQFNQAAGIEQEAELPPAEYTGGHCAARKAGESCNCADECMRWVPVSEDQTEQLMGGKNGERLRESVEQFKSDKRALTQEVKLEPKADASPTMHRLVIEKSDGSRVFTEFHSLDAMREALGGPLGITVDMLSMPEGLDKRHRLSVELKVDVKSDSPFGKAIDKWFDSLHAKMVRRYDRLSYELQEGDKIRAHKQANRRKKQRRQRTGRRS